MTIDISRYQSKNQSLSTSIGHQWPSIIGLPIDSEIVPPMPTGIMKDQIEDFKYLGISAKKVSCDKKTLEESENLPWTYRNLSEPSGTTRNRPVTPRNRPGISRNHQEPWQGAKMI